MCFPEYEELKEWFKIALPLVGHGIAYWVFYRNNAKSDERQRKEWEFKTKTDNDKAYLEKLDNLYGQVYDLNFRFQSFFGKWVSKERIAKLSNEMITEEREVANELLLRTSMTITLYFPMTFKALIETISNQTHFAFGRLEEALNANAAEIDNKLSFLANQKSEHKKLCDAFFELITKEIKVVLPSKF